MKGREVQNNFIRLHGNPLTSGRAEIRLGIARADRVTARVHDISGRLVRRLADRRFAAGEHDLFWDGRDDGGRPVARGLYFVQVQYRNSGFSAVRKITMLRRGTRFPADGRGDAPPVCM